MAESQEFKYHVAMSCGGCSGAITRVLNKAKDAGDVDDFKVSLPGQYATFKTQPDKETAIFEKMTKTGKATHKWDEWAKDNADEVKELEKKEAEEAAKAE